MRQLIVHAANLTILAMHSLQYLLEITTIVNQVIQRTHMYGGTCIVETDSGTVSSVEVSVAAMENLLHGSVWSYQTQQLMILRCAFAVERGLSMMP